MDEQQQNNKKKFLIIGGVIIALLLVLVGAFFFLRGREGGEEGIITSLFGNLGVEVPREGNTPIAPGESSSGGENNGQTKEEEPLFRQLSTFPVAGATSLERGGKTVVRFIARENGFVYETDPRTGVVTQLTNTTVPRIHEAHFALDGGAVILRYLQVEDRLLKKESIRTYLAYLSIPEVSPESTSTDPVLGRLTGDFLPNNITEISVSPDGTRLFYLLPITNGVSGTIVNIRTKEAREVFRNSFSEWIPQLLNDGTIMLTTKASARFEGFAYRYDPDKKTLSRVIRKVRGVTTFADPTGTRTLFNEIAPGSVRLNVWTQDGYLYDEEGVRESIIIPIATLPEKCSWAKNNIRIFCAAFMGTPRGELPDEWYQGSLSFQDTFWTVDTDTSEITFLADPTKEEKAMRSFDVMWPFTSIDERYMIFTNKTDMNLWSFRIPKEKYMEQSEESPLIEEELTEDELKDAAGSQL